MRKMRNLLFALIATTAFAGTAFGQVPPVGPSRCVANCGSPVRGGGGGGSGGGGGGGWGGAAAGAAIGSLINAIGAAAQQSSQTSSTATQSSIRTIRDKVQRKKG